MNEDDVEFFFWFDFEFFECRRFCLLKEWGLLLFRKYIFVLFVLLVLIILVIGISVFVLLLFLVVFVVFMVVGIKLFV